MFTGCVSLKSNLHPGQFKEIEKKVFEIKYHYLFNTVIEVLKEKGFTIQESKETEEQSGSRHLCCTICC